MHLTSPHNPYRHPLRAVFSLVAALTIAAVAFMPAHAGTCTPLPPYASEADRIGVNVIIDHGKTLADYDVTNIKAGWYIDYQAAPSDGTAALRLEAIRPDAAVLSPQLALDDAAVLATHSMAYMPILRLTDLDGDWEGRIGELVDQSPGSLWAIGNEMDRVGQDGHTPAEYAVIYHDLYRFIKQRDPTSRIAIGAIVQPTPLRLRYLDMVLNEYQRRYGTKLPVDVWNIHAFILREDPDAWGADIPPGLEAYAHLGKLYEVADHGDIEIFKQSIRNFRYWMAERGYRNYPLIVSEYGILMPPNYDAGDGRKFDYEFVSEYMLASFEFFRTATDSSTGYSNDGNRLVQAWSWYSLNDYVWSTPDREDGFNGNLLDHDTGAIQLLGQDFARYVRQYSLNYIDLAPRQFSPAKLSLPAYTADVPLDVSISLFNRGNLAANNVRLRFWLGDPDDGGRLIGQKYLVAVLAPRCRATADAEHRLRLPALPPGIHNLVIEATSSTQPEGIPGNNRAVVVLQAGGEDDFTSLFLPLLRR